MLDSKVIIHQQILQLEQTLGFRRDTLKTYLLLTTDILKDVDYNYCITIKLPNNGSRDTLDSVTYVRSRFLKYLKKINLKYGFIKDKIEYNWLFTNITPEWFEIRVFLKLNTKEFVNSSICSLVWSAYYGAFFFLRKKAGLHKPSLINDNVDKGFIIERVLRKDVILACFMNNYLNLYMDEYVKNLLRSQALWGLSHDYSVRLNEITERYYINVIKPYDVSDPKLLDAVKDLFKNLLLSFYQKIKGEQSEIESLLKHNLESFAYKRFFTIEEKQWLKSIINKII